MKKLVLGVLLAAGAQVADSEAAAALTERLADCADLEAAAQRLACFDREVAPLKRPAKQLPAQAATMAPAAIPRQGAVAPQAAVVPPPAPAVATAPALGQEQLPRSSDATAAEKSESLHARITELRKLGPGVYLVSLDNGQAWRHENEALGAFLRQGEAVTISKGNLGTYRLVRDAGKTRDWIRVARVR